MNSRSPQRSRLPRIWGSGGARLGAYASGLDMGLVALGFLVVAVLPSFMGFAGEIPNRVLYVEIYILLALGLNIVVGWTGLLDLGYVSFLVLGAVITAFLCSLLRMPDGTIDWAIGTTRDVTGEPLFHFAGGYLLIMLISGFACLLLGVLRGIPTLRVTGDYYAIVTLGIAEIGFEVALWDDKSLLFDWTGINMTQFTGGAFGAKLAALTRPEFLGVSLRYSTWQFYYLVLAVVVVTVVLLYHLQRSRLGRAFAAIRIDETAARACGVNVSRTKLIAFAVSGFVGGIGGSLYAIWIGTVAVKALDVWQSILVLCCIVLGGMGSIRGVIVGAAVLMLMGEYLRDPVFGVPIPPEARFLVYGIVLIVLMRFRPQGLFPPRRRGRPLSDAERQALLEGDAPLFTLAGGVAGAIATTPSMDASHNGASSESAGESTEASS